MRHAVIFIGPPGSGKSTLLRKYGLEHHSLSMDSLRQISMGAVINENGVWGYEQRNNGEIFKRFMDLIKQRTDRGETLFIEGIFPTPDATLKFIEEQGYTISIVSFYGVTMDFLKERNETRELFKRCSDPVLEKIMARGEAGHKEWMKALVKGNIADYIQMGGRDQEKAIGLLSGMLQNIISPKFVNLADQGINRVVHIGDIQGCNSILVDAIKKNRIWEDGCFTVFAGDLFDRGRENGKVMNTFTNELVPLFKKKKGIVIYGNHEAHIERWMRGKTARSEEFTDFTLPDLLRERVTEKEVRQLFKHIVPFFRYELNGQKVTCTHAGLPRPLPSLWPSSDMLKFDDTLGLVSLSQLSRGTGAWSDPIDQSWQAYVDSTGNTDLFQVHGHRNGEKISALHHKNSICLEGSVEFGGDLRVVIHDESGWKDVSLKNHYKESIALKGQRDDSPPVISKVEAYKASKMKR